MIYIHIDGEALRLNREAAAARKMDTMTPPILIFGPGQDQVRRAWEVRLLGEAALIAAVPPMENLRGASAWIKVEAEENLLIMDVNFDTFVNVPTAVLLWRGLKIYTFVADFKGRHHWHFQCPKCSTPNIVATSVMLDGYLVCCTSLCGWEATVGDSIVVSPLF